VIGDWSCRVFIQFLGEGIRIGVMDKKRF
jgi:hypothetical protein